MHTKGFIFDLDGVIVDTAKYHYLAWKKLANSIGVDFTEVQNEQLKGVSRVKSLEKILNWAGKTISEDQFMELMARKNDDYLSHIAKMDESEILPDVAKTLNFLIKEKQPIALGSASKNAREILKKVNLYDKFDTIVDGNDVTEAKPNPEVFLIAANQLGMKPEDCIVFEDSVAGVQAANTANMISVGIGQQEILHKANDVFTDFAIMGIVYIQELINK